MDQLKDHCADRNVFIREDDARSERQEPSCVNHMRFVQVKAQKQEEHSKGFISIPVALSLLGVSVSTMN